MPIIKSAKKRVRSASKATVRNSKTKRTLKSAVKAFQATLAGDKKKASAALSKAHSNIDKALKKNVIHKNKAARKKSQLAKAAKAANTGLAKKAAAKAPAKKATTKPVPKKSTTKKAPAKKK